MRTTASGFAIVDRTRLVRVFRGENIKNVWRHFDMQLDRMRKAHNRKKDEDKNYEC